MVIKTNKVLTAWNVLLAEKPYLAVMMVVEKLWDVMEKHARERREPNLV